MPYTPGYPTTEGDYPDFTEVAVGNMLVYSSPLRERGNRLASLKEAWLAYCDYVDG